MFSFGITSHNIEIQAMGDLRLDFWLEICHFAQLESQWYFVYYLFSLNTHLHDVALKGFEQHFENVNI